MKIAKAVFSILLGFSAVSCGGDVCDEVGDKVNACFADPACDANASCAEAKMNRGSGEGLACEGAAKALVEACDQSTITPENNCSCSLN